MKKLNWFARPEKFRNRLIMVILGVLIQGFGLSWLIEIHFGTDPCSAFTQGVISHVGLTFGTAQLLINLILFIIIFLSHSPLSDLIFSSLLFPCAIFRTSYIKIFCLHTTSLHIVHYSIAFLKDSE